MIYPFKCEPCDKRVEFDNPISVGPPEEPPCDDCGTVMDRIWTMPTINTSSCRDHDHIPETKRVSRGARNLSKAAATREERKFKNHIDERRKALADGGNNGSFRHTHSVPADLFHGKIRETGDKEYWKDPKNVERHGSTKVS